jgi:Flp pilus assembly pilin Flp
MIRGLWNRLKRLEQDETGAQGLELLLIIAAIVLPLLGVLIWFRNDIMGWVKEIWDTARGKGEEVDVENPF